MIDVVVRSTVTGTECFGKIEFGIENVTGRLAHLLTLLILRSVVWFATGVVFAVFATVLVMQTWRVDAAPGDEDSTFVPTPPCRLFDMRPGELPVGGKKSPLAAGASSVHVQQVTGSVGDCVDIPTDATAVSMNVTIVSPTAQSNLRVYPADVATQPYRI